MGTPTKRTRKSSILPVTSRVRVSFRKKITKKGDLGGDPQGCADPVRSTAFSGCILALRGAVTLPCRSGGESALAWITLTHGRYIMNLQKFTEAQECFVVSQLIAGKSYHCIARDFLEFFPHFFRAVDKAKCEQFIKARCYQFRKDPKTPQYKIIREGMKHRGDDCTHIPFTHKRWRDHKRQNIFDELEDLTDRITAGELQDNKKKAKLLIDCVLVRQKILDDYDKREATRRQLYESTEVH